jgi:hypothetical protein
MNPYFIAVGYSIVLVRLNDMEYSSMVRVYTGVGIAQSV